jgi:hypothetical protein
MTLNDSDMCSPISRSITPMKNYNPAETMKSFNYEKKKFRASKFVKK